MNLAVLFEHDLVVLWSRGLYGKDPEWRPLIAENAEQLVAYNKGLTDRGAETKVHAYALVQEVSL